MKVFVRDWIPIPAACFHPPRCGVQLSLNVRGLE
jgi:hypothetical protein